MHAICSSKTSAWFLLMIVLGGAPLALGETSTLTPETELSLSDLMDIKVESVSKRRESLISAPSAVYVITSEDLRRYGVKRLQDALRLVPGVVQVDKNYSESEFNIREDLVEVPTTVSFQLDGVPIQNPLFGAVYFRGLDLPIEEIDRIEVIRGNGGTVYGANSVTGVVSIYTKHPANSQGFAAAVGGGGPEHANGLLRYGSTLPLGEKTSWSLLGGMSYNTDYDANGNLFRGDSVNAPTPTGAERVANSFTSDKTDKPIDWNAMLQFQTDWTKDLKTSLRFYARGMEDHAYARKAYPYPTLAQAQGKVAGTVIPTVLSKWITNNQTDLALATGYVVVGNDSALTSLMIGKGYVGAMEPVFTALTNAMTAAVTPLLSIPPRDSVWVADVHYRTFTGNLRTDMTFSDNHHLFTNLNGTYNDNKLLDYAFGLVKPNDWLAEFEAQDILDFQPLPWVSAGWITGIDGRYMKADIGDCQPAKSMIFKGKDASEWLRSAFVQGKLTFADQFDVIAGIKGEQWTLVNDDIRWLPTARLGWHPTDYLAFWGSASRGTTVPGYTQTRMEARASPLPSFYPDSTKIPSAALGKWVVITSEPGAPAQAVDYKDLEGGARWQNRTTMVDLSTYYMWANGHIVSSPPDVFHPYVSSFSGDSVVGAYFSNLQDAQLWGVEAMVRNRPLPWLMGEVSYSYHETEITKNIADQSNIGISNRSPKHILKARTSIDMPNNVTVSVAGEYYSSYKFIQRSYDFAQQRFDEAGTSPTNQVLQDNGGRDNLIHLDATLTWTAMDNRLDVTVYGKNLAWWQWGYEAYDYQGTHPDKTSAMYGVDLKWGY